MLPGDDIPVDCIYQDAAIAHIRLLLIEHLAQVWCRIGYRIGPQAHAANLTLNPKPKDYACSRNNDQRTFLTGLSSMYWVTSSVSLASSSELHLPLT